MGINVLLDNIYSSTLFSSRDGGSLFPVSIASCSSPVGNSIISDDSKLRMFSIFYDFGCFVWF